jgi:8-oxo-dGTP pyrophosphatase MutT (NUDIX family)
MRSLSPRALEYLRTWDGTVAVPRDAATIVVVRAAETGPEVLLLRRPQSMQFAAGMHVFPGGTLQPGDWAPTPWLGPRPDSWATRWRTDDELAGALVVAAVRETFEETGILIAGPDEHTVIGGGAGEEWSAARAALDSGELTLGEFLSDRGLLLRADLLAAWAHWITPDFEPRRYDTRFFLAVLPADRANAVHGTEADSSFWIDAEAAVRAAESGDIAMMAPTLSTLRDLARASRQTKGPLTADVMHRVIRTVRPRAVEVDGRYWLTSAAAGEAG